MKFTLAFAVLALISSNAQAFDLTGTKTVSLVSNDEKRIEVATINFKQEGDKSSYTIVWMDEKFSEHFLSMRPFRCLEGPEKYLCRVPYPYPIKRLVSAADLTDLEYDTMFLWKGATEYGINMWNGVYYRLKDDGDRLIGEVNDIDMNSLASPPENGDLRPITNDDLHVAEKESHWLSRIVIE